MEVSSQLKGGIHETRTHITPLVCDILSAHSLFVSILKKPKSFYISLPHHDNHERRGNRDEGGHRTSRV